MLRFGAGGISIVVFGGDIYAFLEQRLVLHELGVVVSVHLLGVITAGDDHQTVLVFGATVGTCGQVMMKSTTFWGVLKPLVAIIVGIFLVGRFDSYQLPLVPLAAAFDGFRESWGRIFHH